MLMKTKPVNQPPKPLPKDISFWIVVVTLVGAANWAQIYFGAPWLQQKLAAAQPAKISAAAASVDVRPRAPAVDNEKGTPP